MDTSVSLSPVRTNPSDSYSCTARGFDLKTSSETADPSSCVLDEHLHDRRADPAPLPLGKEGESDEEDLAQSFLDEQLADVGAVDLDHLSPGRVEAVVEVRTLRRLVPAERGREVGAQRDAVHLDDEVAVGGRCRSERPGNRRHIGSTNPRCLSNVPFAR